MSTKPARATEGATAGATAGARVVVVNLPPPIQPGGDRSRVFVKPAHVRIEMPPEQVQAVQFNNNTGDVVKLWIPTGAALFKPPDKHPGFDHEIEIPDKGHKTLDVLPHPTRGRYLYQVYCNAINNYAEGNSAPEITVP
jgi:hypothetical protein